MARPDFVHDALVSVLDWSSRFVLWGSFRYPTGEVSNRATSLPTVDRMPDWICVPELARENAHSGGSDAVKSEINPDRGGCQSEITVTKTPLRQPCR
jgi:hypothetical protein